MWMMGLLVALLQQAVPLPPAPVVDQVPVVDRVIVELLDGRQLSVENPQFSGFIRGKGGDAVLMYRQQNLHSELPTHSIAKIEFGRYKGGKPFAMLITLKNGQTLEAESERQNYVMLTGRTDIGTVTIKHPDPISSPVRLTTHKPDRHKDLTIQSLEFPPS